MHRVDSVGDPTRAPHVLPLHPARRDAGLGLTGLVQRPDHQPTAPLARRRPQTGHDEPADLAVTPDPSPEELGLLRGPVCHEMMETYPEFCRRVWQRNRDEERAAWGDLHEERAKQGAALEVERTRCLPPGQEQSFLAGPCRLVPRRDELEAVNRPRVHELLRLPVSNREGRAERLVPMNQCLKALSQDADIQSAVQTQAPVWPRKCPQARAIPTRVNCGESRIARCSGLPIHALTVFTGPASVPVPQASVSPPIHE